MDLILPLHPSQRGWLLDSDLEPYVDAYTNHLKLGRYATTTTDRYLQSIAHFAHWMNQCQLEVKQLDEASVSHFLNDHLPHCDCPKPAFQHYSNLRAACGHLLRVLRETEVIGEPVVILDLIDEELREFDDYMRRVRGLAKKTRSGRLLIVRRLLTEHFADRPVEISMLQSTDVRQFIANQLDLGNNAASALASALRAYFRYRTTCGDQVHALTGVISSPAHWKLASLPRSLSDEQIKYLLGSFTPDIPSYRRGYAMVRCALDIGLRTSEIARLALSDINWQAGTVMLRRTKSRREDILPLPAVTGQAIVDYLRVERPPTVNQAVFVRCIAPHDVPIGPDAVRRVIRDAYQRIGLEHTRAHALRHSFARRLIENGGSIKEVADMLRHRSLNTSLIYAKLDNHRLRAVALPWLGDGS